MATLTIYIRLLLFPGTSLGARASCLGFEVGALGLVFGLQGRTFKIQGSGSGTVTIMTAVEPHSCNRKRGNMGFSKN